MPDDNHVKIWATVQDYLTVLEPVERRLFKSCCIPHWFDEDILQALDSDVFETKALHTRLLQSPFVSRNRFGGYSINIAVRELVLNEMWIENASALKNQARRLSKYFAKRYGPTPEFELRIVSAKDYNQQILGRCEWLFHLLLVDELAALSHLSTYMEQSLIEFDLGSSYQYLHTLNEHLQYSRLSQLSSKFGQYWQVKLAKVRQDNENLKNYLVQHENFSVRDRIVGSLEWFESLLEISSRVLALEQTNNIQSAWASFLELYKRMYTTVQHRTSEWGKILLQSISSGFGISLFDSYLKLGYNLPDSPDIHFVDREMEMALLDAVVTLPKIVVLVGVAGSGKTALAHQWVASRMAKDELQYVFWTTAKRDRIVGESNFHLTINEASLQSNSLFKMYFQEANRKSSGRQEIQPRAINTVKSFFEYISLAHQDRQSILLVIDGLDEVDDFNRNDFLVEISKHVRVLATSRKRLNINNSMPIEVNPLGELDSAFLCRRLTDKHGLQSQLTAHDLTKIYTATKGIPLTIRWTMSQLIDHPLDEILLKLKDKDTSLAKFLRRDLERLPSLTVRILQYLASSDRPIRRSELAQQESYSSADVDGALNDLAEFSFVKSSENSSDPKDDLFSINPVVREQALQIAMTA